MLRQLSSTRRHTRVTRRYRNSLHLPSGFDACTAEQVDRRSTSSLASASFIVDNGLCGEQLCVAVPLLEILVEGIAVLLLLDVVLVALDVFSHRLRNLRGLLHHYIRENELFALRLLPPEFLQVLAEILHYAFVCVLRLVHDPLNPFQIAQ